MIRVLVVDDSALMRALLRRKLEAESDIIVVAAAANAAEARELIKLHDPDVVTLDIEMPGMDGLSFLEKIMTLRPTPVIIVSGSTHAGAAATARALQLGAVDCYAKATATRSLADDDGGELARLVREAAKVRLAPRQPASAPAPAPTPALAPAPDAPPAIIAIGSSTGGVEALHSLLAGFPADCPPTLIVQHINPAFAPAIVQSLQRITPAEVMLADSDLMLRRGQIMLAPGDEKHLMVAGAGAQGFRSVLRPGEKVSGHRPSVDRLFQSVAETIGASALGILLTGMGEDGARGLLAMARTGARTIAQDEASCVVFGMPRAAIALGAAGEVLPLGAIAPRLFAAAQVTP
ncbi:MAG: chemotaxis-specific protein-glutamate methyltransferase CheB [Erythrobacter sp.]